MSTQASPKDSMKSTWLHGGRSRWKWSHRLLARQLAAHPEYDDDIPVHAKTDPMPVVASWTPHVFVLLAYRGGGGGGGGADAATPLDVAADLAWWAWLAVHIGVYTLALDSFFYWYHRAMHDVPALWKLHRRHHLTKHPNALLTGYADDE
ncbi:hypothetical protein G3M48_000431 [Beauveria asiatica]|uniref:Fatty acid hydroxylase domain-containing protein n=1 Tax=Beauveria asiatica TaxID=1069075 RepID=A0AAW0S0R0_9HYPO